MKKNLKIIMYFTAFIFLFICGIKYREQLSAGVTFGIDYSLQNLIPSLFPLMFLSCAITNSPAKNAVSYIFSPVCRYILRLPNCCACAVIFGLCCGYPVGAKITSILYKSNEISKDEARRLSLFCINPGFPFCVIFIGGVVFQNLQLGMYIFIAISIASLLIGVALSYKQKIPPKKLLPDTDNNFADIIAKSASQSLSSSLTMCLYVTIFSAFLPIFNLLNVLSYLQIPFISPLNSGSVFWFIWEVTRGVITSCNAGVSYDIFVIGLAFGGLCVHFQVFSLFPKNVLSYSKFYFARVTHCVFSLFIFKIICEIKPIELSAFSTFSVEIVESTAATSICLILLASSFIYLNKNVENTKNL